MFGGGREGLRRGHLCFDLFITCFPLEDPLNPAHEVTSAPPVAPAAPPFSGGFCCKGAGGADGDSEAVAGGKEGFGTLGSSIDGKDASLATELLVLPGMAADDAVSSISTSTAPVCRRRV